MFGWNTFEENKHTLVQACQTVLSLPTLLTQFPKAGVLSGLMWVQFYKKGERE